MKRSCIAVVDAARARLYTYQEDPAHELKEVADLVNPGRRLRTSELFSDSRPGSDRGFGERDYTFDDHRDAHVENMDLQFAREVVVEIDRIVREGAYLHVIVVASPKMLGDLRKVDAVLHRADLVLDEIPRDLAKLTSPQLHDRLAELKLIPPRHRVTAAQR